MAALQRNLKKVGGQIENTAETAKTAPVDFAALQTDIELLLKKVKDRDPMAKSLVREINRSLSGDLFEGALTSIQLALETYDFKKAETYITRVKSLLKKRGEDE
jgi:hypothetical protein